MSLSVPLGEFTLAGLLGGLFGGLIATFLTHKFASWRDKKKEFRDAGRQFREAFVELQRLLLIRHPMHANLYPGAPEDYKNISELLPRWYEPLKAALLKFEPYLSEWKQKKLRNIWDDCFDVDPDHKYPTFIKYETRGDHNVEMRNREIVLKNISDMFEYTK